MLCLQGPCAPLGRMEPTHAFSSGLNMDPDIELPHIPDAGYGAAEDEIQMPEPHESQTRLVVAEEASGAKLHGVIQHQLYNRFMDARLHSRLAQETRPLLLMSYALAVGPNRSSSTTISPIPIKEENPQTTDGDRAQNTTSKGSRNGLYGIIANALSVAMVLNACKALATLSRLGDSQYPWEMGLVYLCWWSMVGLCGVAFSFSGGYQANFYALLQEMQGREHFFVTEHHIKQYGSKCRIGLAVSVLFMSLNLMVFFVMKYAIALGTAEVTTQLLCYPINHRSAVCQYVVFPVMAVLHIQYTAYWIGVTVLFMLLCDAYASMYAELPTEIVSRLRWCRSTDLQTSTKTVVNDMTLKHQEMNDAIKKAASQWRWWITAVVCFDIPLLTFTIYNIILMLKEPGLNPVMFGTTLFWTAAGFAHLLSVTVSAARVTSAADDLPRMLLQPRIQQLMVGDVAETQGIVMVFNKYMDQHPPCFHVFHVKITNELVGTVLSLILGYVLVLATL